MNNLALVDSLLSLTNELKQSTDKYIRDLDSSAFMSFSVTHDDRKKIARKYNLYTSKISQIIGRFNSAVAVLCDMICHADKMCDSDGTAYLYKIFEESRQLSLSVDEFMRTSDQLLSETSNEQNFSISAMLTAARTLNARADSFERSLAERK